MTANRIMRRLAAICIGLVALIAAASPGRAQIERLAGRFVGVAEAEGMVIDLRAERGRLVGTFTDSNGLSAPVEARMEGSAAEAMLTFPARKVRIRFFPEGLGLRLISIPLDESGQPLIDDIHILAFVPEGTRMPELPAGYTPPSYRVRVVDPDSFLVSYPFWPPEAVAFGYESIEPRYRPMFALFPHVLGDILWKLCSSSYRPAVLGEALRGQGVTCDSVLAAFRRILTRGRFDAWKAAVEKEAAILLPALRCARGYVVRPEICQPAARAIADRAVAMNSVAAVLGRF